MTNYILVTTKDLDVKSITDRLLKGEFTEKEAASLIHKSRRQAQRIKKNNRDNGLSALVHHLRGRPSNH